MVRRAVELSRRRSLIDAAVRVIGEEGSLDVPVRRIAERAGMSPALAFHYFGDKDAIVVATMRHLMREFAAEARRGMAAATTPSQRIEALVRASFSPAQFDRATVAAWLVFYLRAHSSPQARRLLKVYQSRLRSNLANAFRAIVPGDRAAENAELLGSLIDGLYIRHALDPNGPDAAAAIGLCRRWLEATCRTDAS